MRVKPNVTHLLKNDLKQKIVAIDSYMHKYYVVHSHLNVGTSKIKTSP